MKTFIVEKGIRKYQDLVPSKHQFKTFGNNAILAMSDFIYNFGCLQEIIIKPSGQIIWGDLIRLALSRIEILFPGRDWSVPVKIVDFGEDVVSYDDLELRLARLYDLAIWNFDKVAICQENKADLPSAYELQMDTLGRYLLQRDKVVTKKPGLI